MFDPNHQTFLSTILCFGNVEKFLYVQKAAFIENISHD